MKRIAILILLSAVALAIWQAAPQRHLPAEGNSLQDRTSQAGSATPSAAPPARHLVRKAPGQRAQAPDYIQRKVDDSLMAADQARKEFDALIIRRKRGLLSVDEARAAKDLATEEYVERCAAIRQLTYFPYYGDPEEILPAAK